MKWIWKINEKLNIGDARYILTFVMQGVLEDRLKQDQKDEI